MTTHPRSADTGAATEQRVVYRYVHPNGSSEPVKVRRAARDYPWCDHCEKPIAKGELHAVAYRAFAWHFCLSCVTPVDEIPRTDAEIEGAE